VRISAKADYAVRAVVELVGSDETQPRKGDDLAASQDIPLSFLENILIQLKSAGIVRSQRGREGGYWLGQPGDQITVAQVIRAVEGPLASVRGERPENVAYAGAAESLQTVWIALRASLRSVLDRVTVADIASGELPNEVIALTDDEDAWRPA
jgi:Rrf2 family protein